MCVCLYIVVCGWIPYIPTIALYVSFLGLELLTKSQGGYSTFFYRMHFEMLVMHKIFVPWQGRSALNQYNVNNNKSAGANIVDLLVVVIIKSLPHLSRIL